MILHISQIFTLGGLVNRSQLILLLGIIMAVVLLARVLFDNRWDDCALRCKLLIDIVRRNRLLHQSRRSLGLKVPLSDFR